MKRKQQKLYLKSITSCRKHHGGVTTRSMAISHFQRHLTHVRVVSATPRILPPGRLVQLPLHHKHPEHLIALDRPRLHLGGGNTVKNFLQSFIRRRWPLSVLQGWSARFTSSYHGNFGTPFVDEAMASAYSHHDILTFCLEEAIRAHFRKEADHVRLRICSNSRYTYPYLRDVMSATLANRRNNLRP